MVDCRLFTKDGDGRGAPGVPKILEHILKWMSRVIRWNAVFMLASNNCATDIRTILTAFDGSNDIVIQEGTYTFSCQSLDAKTSIVKGARKLYF
jgi:hydroxymethylglutaryl-CoA reductase